MNLKIAVISDLHCLPTGHKRESSTWLHSDALRTPSVRHPVESLRILIEKEALSADMLFCLGDITDSVDRQGFVSGWGYIEEISRMLKIDHGDILSTIGNHDVASQTDNPKSAFEIAKNLKYNFPLPDDDLNKSFWADHYCYIEKNDLRILVFNSVYQSYTKEDGKKINISPYTLEKIEKALKNTDRSRFGIAMSHHHPLNHYNTDYRDDDVIDKGDELLSLLNKYGFKLFIHGHKHQPMLRNFNNMNILASGSFSCIENLKETESLNMFHIIELIDGKGIINSWVYGPSSGWHKKNSSKNLPNFAGFGFDGDVNQLAQSLNQKLNEQPYPMLSLRELDGVLKDVFYLRPDQQEILQEVLASNYSISVIPSLTVGFEAYLNKQIPL